MGLIRKKTDEENSKKKQVGLHVMMRFLTFLLAPGQIMYISGSRNGMQAMIDLFAEAATCASKSCRQLYMCYDVCGMFEKMR